MGGAIRDLFILNLEIAPGISYGLVFALEAIGLFTAVLVLLRVDVIGFARDAGRLLSRTEVQIASAD